VALERKRAPRPDFSDLDLEVLRLIVEGFTNREIAEQMHRSENTIKFHVRRILERTAASNRTELARRATQEGWL
jgi:DNA-binding NarL/FixJ family response regulator